MGVIHGRAVLTPVFALPNGPWTIALCAVLGAIIGSYLATIALRWPQGRGASSGRSACDGCGGELRWFELIPVLSFLLSRGRCRRCDAYIARLHFGLEIGAATLGGAAAATAPTFGTAIIMAMLFWQLLVLAVLDFRHLWLPDRLTLVLAICGLTLGGFIGGAPLSHRAIAMVGGFAALEIIRRAFYRIRRHEGMGAGDPKMFGAIGAWVGPFAMPFIILIAATIGLFVAGMCVVRGRPMAAFPFGTYLAAAAVVCTLYSVI
jgi:leader peptidase (prepilin peptidase) / N-methyltransferase